MRWYITLRNQTILLNHEHRAVSPLTHTHTHTHTSSILFYWNTFQRLTASIYVFRRQCEGSQVTAINVTLLTKLLDEAACGRDKYLVRNILKFPKFTCTVSPVIYWRLFRSHENLKFHNYIASFLNRCIGANYYYYYYWDRLCGLVVRVSGYRYRGPGFDPRRYQIFWVVVGLERGPISLVRSNWGGTWIKK